MAIGTPQPWVQSHVGCRAVQPWGTSVRSLYSGNPAEPPHPPWLTSHMPFKSVRVYIQRQKYSFVVAPRHCGFRVRILQNPNPKNDAHTHTHAHAHTNTNTKTNTRMHARTDARTQSRAAGAHLVQRSHLYGKAIAVSGAGPSLHTKQLQTTLSSKQPRGHWPTHYDAQL
jgi:hypothetical protein